MKYAVKAPDGNYMRWPGECGSSHTIESGWNSSLDNADLFSSEEDARYRISNMGFGKWEKATVVPVELVDQTEIEPKPAPRFLFVANKPSSSDYCRGCLMASYSSDYIMENMLTAEQLVKQWAECLHRNMNLDCNEAGYEFHIFKDGIKVWNETYSTWDGGQRYEYESDDYYAHYSELEAQEQADQGEINDLHAQAKALAEQMQNGQKEKERQEAEAKRLKEEADAKERRRKEFERLKEEFK